MSKHRKNKNGGAKPGSLLQLATARTGVEVPIDNLQLLNKDSGSAVMSLMMEFGARVVAKAKSHHDPKDLIESIRQTGFRQDDGSLNVYMDCAGFPSAMLSVPAGEWRILSDEALQAVESEVRRLHEANPESLNVLLEGLADHASLASEHLKETQVVHRRQLATSTQVVMVADRRPECLERLTHILHGQPVLISRIDDWLAGSDELAFISRGPDPSSNWILTSPDLDTAALKTLPEITEYIMEPSKVALALGSLPGPAAQRLIAAWRDLGGLVLGIEEAARDSEEPTLQARRVAVRELDGILLIVDRSATGRDAVRDLAARITVDLGRACSEAFDRLLAGCDHFLVINFFSNDGVDRFTLPAEEMTHLLEILQTAMTSRSKPQAGLCQFAIAVSDESKDAVEYAVRHATSSLSALMTPRQAVGAPPQWKSPAGNSLPFAMHVVGQSYLTCVEISRASIESSDVKGLVDLMCEMVHDVDTALAACQSLMVSVSGYDKDHRALQDIPEVRAFCSAVSAQCPWWIHLIAHHAMPQINTVSWWPIALSKLLGPTEYHASGYMRMHIDTQSLKLAMMDSLRASADLYSRLLQDGGDDRAFAAAIAGIGSAMESVLAAAVPMQ